MRRTLTRLLTPALGLALLVPATAITGAAPALAADATSVTIAGSLQSELGCAADWAPDCAKTHLTQGTGADSTRWTGVFTVPAGSYEFKAAINDSWDENYGPGGRPNPQDNIPLVLAADTEVRFTYDAVTHLVGVAPTAPLPGLQPSDSSLALSSLRKNLTQEQFYFVMADRFANGNTADDQGGLSGGRSVTGFDPTDKAYYHGGDIQGLTSKLDYIKGLGTTAIWLTPSFKNRPVQGSGQTESAGYHGYWITDFTQVDPHLGTNADLKDFIDKAHAKGVKVFFDIITNHTADVIQYAENKNGYIYKGDAPYKDANGNVFDDRDYAGKANFPALDATKSFPYTPVFAKPEDATVKVPAWLNDPTLYHNRGDSTYTGESTTYGDFSGLDDLFTENPKVEKGMEDIYKAWVDFGIDGFRIDTAKHVNMEFWQAWSPEILKHAADIGNPDFFMFGEVYDANPVATSPYSKEGKLPATLDFGFQASARDFADGKPTSNLRDFFAKDDLYTDADSNVYDLPTFLGNHDMGRIGYFLKSDNPGMPAAELTQRDELAHSLMYLTRGQPVVYYGDEQGFTGAEGGNDQQARQDMFASSVDYYNNDVLITGEKADSKERYDTGAPLYQHIAELSALTKKYPALRNGSQLHRYSSSAAGIYAFSRIDPQERVEYVVAANNATTAKTVTIDTLTERMTFDAIYPAGAGSARADDEGRLTITVPALSAIVWKAQRRVHQPAAAPVATFTSPVDGMPGGDNAEIAVKVPAGGYNQVTFSYRVHGDTGWTVLGTDDNAPYRVFQDTRGIPAGTLLDYRAVLKDSAGHLSVASSTGLVGQAAAPAPAAGGPTGPVVTPDSVTVAGDLDSEIGCPGDWQPDCATAHMTKGSGNVWSKTVTLPGGSYAYKAALNDSWQENYGAGAVKDGGNIPLVVPAGGASVTFYYDQATHWITDNLSTKIAVAAGSFQSELGCEADWSPACLNSWLQDPDGDGTFTLSTTAIPAGTYEGKVAIGLSWDENYGAGGTPNGANISFTVPADGQLTTMSYDSASHLLSVSSGTAAVRPDISKQEAYWVSEGVIAWKVDDPASSTFRLSLAADGGLAVDDEAITGGTSIPLTYDPAGLPADVTARFPQLASYAAFRLPRKFHGNDVKQALKGQLAVAQYDDLGRLTAATGLQTPGVLDDIYGADAADRTLGLSWKGSKPELALWAPTARSVSVQVFDSPTGAAVSTTALTPAGDGVWTVTGSAAWKGRYYLYDVEVFVPETGTVEHNVVTDPYSLGLSTNSTRSLFVDLADKSLQPAGWATLAKPALPRPEAQSIYELHVRDFSISDSTVPAAHRGTYAAFGDTGSNGMKHLKSLAASGLTTVHLLPVFDISTIAERRSDQQTPPCDLASYAPDSEEQQACVTQITGKDGYNWGYDPAHYTTPEGSYSTDPEGATRSKEFRGMVSSLNTSGLRVVMDVVYNHTTDSGQTGTNNLDKIVPGYYHRLNAKGAVETSTCCANTATEHTMMGKLLEDSVLTWATAYKVDGFRFDLMGHQPKAVMVDLRKRLDALTLKKNGVDGKSVYLYGEGWNFGEVANDALFVQATQANMAGTGIGTFNDRQRDAVRGGGPFDEDPRIQGFGSGLYTDPNGDPANGTPEEQKARLLHSQDLLKVGLTGNLKGYSFVDATGKTVTGGQVDYNGSPAGYTSDPQESITYVDAHDNETLFDALAYKLPQSTPMADRIRMQTLSLSTTALGQGVSFWHAGAEILRSKSLDRNSYDSGDWFNVFDPSYSTNGFGRGLPPKTDNEAKWSYAKPLLADPALKPSTADILSAKAQSETLLQIRKSSPLFTLGTAALIQQKLSFPDGGPNQAAGVVVMKIDDTVGPDVDPALRGIVVVFNGSDEATTQSVPGTSGSSYALHPAQAGGSDAVVKTASYSAGSFTVPARTAAVFVAR